jgi:hypothetical protein
VNYLPFENCEFFTLISIFPPQQNLGCNFIIIFSTTILEIYWLIDWLFTVLRSAQEYFTYIETSPLPVKGCKILAYARRSGPLNREGFLSCHACCNTGPWFFRSHPKDRPIQWPLTTRMGMRKTYSNPDLEIYVENIINDNNEMKHT